MSENEAIIWSNTDYPYACLIDKIRTEAFREAIKKVVKPGSVVVDVGSGSGILALFAAEAGAEKVYAVEIDPILVECLRATVEVSPYKDKIEVVEGNAEDVGLPQNVDVVIAELIETSLIDEMQVPVMNSMHEKGIIGAKTKVIPQGYETYMQLADVENTFYGHKIMAPIHMWPYYSATENNWHPLPVKNATPKVQVVSLDFEKRQNSLQVDRQLDFELNAPEAKFNSIRVSGVLHLTDGISINDTNAVNGDKVWLLPDSFVAYPSKPSLHVAYEMGGGMGKLKITRG